MSIKRIHRNTPRSEAEVARDKLVREQYLREKPTLDELASREDYTPSIAQGVMLDMMQIGSRLRDIRVKRGWSLADVSERCGMDRAAISRLENGIIENPTIGTLDTYARAIGAEIRFLVHEVEGIQ